MKGCKVLLLFGFTLCLVTALVNCEESEDETDSEEEDYLDDDLEDEPGQHGQGHPGQGHTGQGSPYPSRLEMLELEYKSLKHTLEFKLPASTSLWTDKYKELQRLKATIKELKK